MPLVKKVAPLFQARPKNFSIGNDIQPKRDLSRYVRWPKYIRIQRQRAVLLKTLKIPRQIKQFSESLDHHTTVELFKLLHKYRPESKRAKKIRLCRRAEVKIEKGLDSPTVKPCFVTQGVNSVVKTIEQKRASLVIMAGDVDPLELVLFLPALCKKMGVPYCIVRSKAQLGVIAGRRTCSALALSKVEAGDHQILKNLVERIKPNIM